MYKCDNSYVESLCKGRSLLIGTGCNCIPKLVEDYGVSDVITLYESWECEIHEHIVEKAKEGRYNLYHLPVQDFTVNPVRHVIEAARLIAKLLALGRSVLVACYGGCGRTGTVITLFNIVYRCMDFETAMLHYARRRGCGPESPEQEALLYEAARLVGNVCTKPLMSEEGCTLYRSDYDPEFILRELARLSP